MDRSLVPFYCMKGVGLKTAVLGRMHHRTREVTQLSNEQILERKLQILHANLTCLLGLVMSTTRLQIKLLPKPIIPVSPAYRLF